MFKFNIKNVFMIICIVGILYCIGVVFGGIAGSNDISSSGNLLARKIGLGGHVTLPYNQKLITVTYKENSMWLLYRPMRKGEEAETYTFQEDSMLGLLEGTVTIEERKQ